jgi:hypothetical protein
MFGLQQVGPDRFSPGQELQLWRVKRKSNYHGFKGKGKFKGKSKSYFVVQCPCSPVG